MNSIILISSRGTGEDEFIQGADELIRAYNDGDEDEARAILSKPFVKFMDNCVSRQRDNVKKGFAYRKRICSFLPMS
jgi:hypothetical protein